MATRKSKTKKNTFIQKETSKTTPSRKPKKKKSTKSQPPALNAERIRLISGIFLVFLAIYLFFSVSSYFVNWILDGDTDDIIGRVSFYRVLTDSSLTIHNWTGRLGAAIAHQLIKNSFGISAYLLTLIIGAMGLHLLRPKMKVGRLITKSILWMIWLSLSLGFVLQNTSSTLLGGLLGYQGALSIQGILGKIGLGLILLFTLGIYLVFLHKVNVSFLFNRPSRPIEPVDPEPEAPKNEFRIELDDTTTTDTDPVTSTSSDSPLAPDPIEEPEERTTDFETVELPDKPKSKTDKEVEFTIEQTESEETNQLQEKATTEHFGLDTEFDPQLDLPDFKPPTIDLLKEHSGGSTSVNKAELEANKQRIVETLNNYAIKIDKIKATIGPTVTLYEIIPAPGVRISKIKNLEDDIALSLSALGIRIIAPIPGKGTIGIEVPNQNPEIVSLKPLIASEKFRNTHFELPFVLGKTIANENYIVDLAKMPHILMAGATGQGKSVGLNTIIASLLYRKHPAELKFIMVDPKKVELSLYSKIERHYLAQLPDAEESIITDTRQVVRVLNSLCIEMDNRYNLLKDAQVRNIKEYNTKFKSRQLNPNEGHRFLPYIVLVVDEFADLIMTAGKEIEVPITRLAQLARAIGIHLIIATQRPSVNIITGTIKANFPARIAFRVIQKTDSRTILDSGGAEQLIGRGDMLLSTGSDLVRLQCAFVDTPEVAALTEYIGSQRGYANAYDLPEYFDDDANTKKDFDPNERDELFEDAAIMVVQHQHGSTSLLQRKLKLGYNRAGRLIDQLEAAGIVGPFEGSKARQVNIANEMALEQYLKDLN